MFTTAYDERCKRNNARKVLNETDLVTATMKAYKMIIAELGNLRVNCHENAMSKPTIRDIITSEVGTEHEMQYTYNGFGAVSRALTNCSYNICISYQSFS